MLRVIIYNGNHHNWCILNIFSIGWPFPYDKNDTAVPKGKRAALLHEKSCKWSYKQTRMHSSRMYTVCYSGRVLWGGCLPEGGSLFLPRRRDFCPGVSAWGCLTGWGRLPGGAWLNRCLPDTSHLWTESHTGVKTLPCHNYVTDGSYCIKWWI